MGGRTIWQVVVDTDEQRAPAAVMTRLALDRALPAAWIDEVFEQNRRRQYPRELLFSSVVELMTLVTLGLRPSLHAAARKMADRLPVSLAALYAKVKRTEPGLLRARVRGSAERLAPAWAGPRAQPNGPAASADPRKAAPKPAMSTLPRPGPVSLRPALSRRQRRKAMLLKRP